MVRRAFFSFHYDNDSHRAQLVRNMGVIESNPIVNSNEWETVHRGGYRAIKKWIDDQMHGKSVVIVLIGAATAGRPWVEYEIEKGWSDGKGVMGVRIHDLKDMRGNTSPEGRNPFDDFVVVDGKLQKESGSVSEFLLGEYLSDVVETYDSPLFAFDSKDVFNNIRSNLGDWIEDAIRIRADYPA